MLLGRSGLGEELFEALRVVERADHCKAESLVGDQFLGDSLDVLGGDGLDAGQDFLWLRGAALEDPKGMILFGLRSEVLENRVREPDEVLAGFDAVTAADLQRVAQDVMRESTLNLALIGPFEDLERFEQILALSA